MAIQTFHNAVVARKNEGVAAPTMVTRPTVARTGDSFTIDSDGTWTGSPTITYSWKKDGVAIGGETTDTYDATGIPGNYLAYVTATNAGGAVTVVCETGEATLIFGGGDSTWAESWVTTGRQAELDSRFGAGAFDYANVAQSGFTADQVDTNAETAVDPYIHQGSSIWAAQAYANTVSGLQGSNNAATTYAMLVNMNDNRLAVGAFVIACTAPYRAGGLYDGSTCYTASESMRSNWAGLGYSALADFYNTPYYDNIELNDGIHPTSAIQSVDADIFCDAVAASGVPGFCGAFEVIPEDFTNLRVYSLSDSYVFDAVNPLPLAVEVEPFVTTLEVISGTGWTPGTYTVSGVIDSFSTPEAGDQTLWALTSAPAAVGTTGGTYTYTL